MKIRAALLVGVLAAIVTLVAGPAGAADGVGKVTVNNPSPTRSSTIEVASTGWRPGSGVSITLWGTDTALAHSTADASGDVHARVEIPADAHPGFTVLSVSGSTAAGVPQEIVTALSVIGEAPVRAPQRPWTPVFLLAALATLLMLASQRVMQRDPQLAS